MRKPLSQVFSRYGAPMGRHNQGEPEGVKVYLEHVPLDSGGYDKGGAYWGLRTRQERKVICIPIGSTQPVERTIHQTPRIYRYYTDNTEGFLEAFDREDAKRQLIDEYPTIKFYR